MNKTFQQLMEKMMSGMMKPEDMPHMMETMMDNIFGQMSAQDRIAFIENMMPRCMSMIFSEIDEESRKEVAMAMLTKLADVLKQQL
jgi:hypothetical protein